MYDGQDIKNNNIPRTIDAIYLRPSPDMPNGHDIMDLYTGRKISRPQLTKCNMSPIIIDRVEELGKHQGVKSLKFCYQKSEDWLPVDIDKLLLPEELEDKEV